MSRSRDDSLFWVGVTLWVAVIAATWPNALSFGDEVGYVGRAKLLLEGHLGYVKGSAGAWVETPRGLVSMYPISFSLLMAPLFAIAPRAIFAIAVISAVALAVTTRAVLRSWGKSPLWALLVLAHPTFVILSRTAMADVAQAAAVVGAWWLLRRGRLAAVACLVLLVLLKPTGVVLAFGVVAAEVITSFGELRARDRQALRRLALGVGGGALALVALAGANYLGAGTIRFAYKHDFIATPPFWYTYLPLRAPVHLLTVLANPPLLIAGVWAFWKRRERGAALLAIGFLALMCTYFFVDTGPTRVESLVLSPRLIMPAVAFLLVGYGAWLDDLARRLLGARAFDEAGGARPWLAAVLMALPLAVVVGVSARHAQFQEPMGRALVVASGLADARGGHVLGITESAVKTGLLYHGQTTVFDPASNRPAVVLCSEISASHRVAMEQRSCALEGYREIGREGGFVVLTRP